MLYSNINDIISKYNNLLINYNKFFFNNIIINKNYNLTKNIYIKGINLIQNVFNISFLYLDNLGDVYNLCEKSYIYFIEFINQINISNNIENSIDLTIKDAVIFCYKKTILNFENNLITNDNNINCIVLNKIKSYINIVNNLNIIYTLEIHNNIFKQDLNIDNNEENTDKLLNIKLSIISKKISYYIKKINNNKILYNNLENDESNISDKSINNLSFFINYIFEYILKTLNDNNFNYQIFYNIIDKYISKDVYISDNNIMLFDKHLLDDIIDNNDIKNINKLFIIQTKN